MTGFWIYICVVTMLIPLTMIGFGRLFSKRAPKEINVIFGYRTSRSMKNRDTWEFAHRHMGKLWFRWGIILLALSFAAMLLLLERDREVLEIWGGVLTSVQLVWLLLPVFSTEKALKKTFDENGRRR